MPADTTPWARVEAVLRVAGDDPLAVAAIERVLYACTEYVKAVVDKEASLAARRHVEAPDAYRELAEDLDRRRTLAHNALLSALKVCNRTLFHTFHDAIPPGGLYSGDPYHLLDAMNRVAIGDWAGELVRGRFEGRPR